MPVTFFYPNDTFDKNITLYADSLSVGVVANNRAIPIRDVNTIRVNYPVYIPLGFTGQTIKISGVIDDLPTFSKYLELYPDTLLKTLSTSANYTEFNNDGYWEIKELSSSAVPGASFLRKFTMTVTQQHNIEVRG